MKDTAAACPGVLPICSNTRPIWRVLVFFSNLLLECPECLDTPPRLCRVHKLFFSVSFCKFLMISSPARIV